ncbi:MAG: S8 family serine peptidase [Pseudomonadota bacterium]
MADVFLSYKNTEERRRIVTRFATILRAHGITVWWDYGLEAGESYAEQIAAALDEARIVIPFWCEESIKSEWVQQEAARGEEKLFPARLQRISPPPRFEMLHAAHLEHWDGSILDPTVDEFVRDICRKLGKPVELAPDTRAELASLPPLDPLAPVGGVAETEPAIGPAAAAEARRGRGGLWAAMAVLAVAIGGGTAWFSGLLPGLMGPSSPTSVHAATDDTPPATRPEPIAWIAPNDPLLDLQWYLGPADEGGAGILEYRAAAGVDGTGITIAHIDSGVFERHTEFLRSRNLIDGFDMVSDPDFANDGDGRDPDPTDPGDACPASGSEQDSFHGTFNASIIVANTNNGEGIAGVAPGAKVQVFRALGKCGGRASDINDALRWAGGLIPVSDSDGNEIWNEEDVDIALVPIGLVRACLPSVQDAINSLREAGILVVTSAGNQRIATQYYTPGGCEGVIAVGATDARGALAPYTNSDVALVAPGGDLGRDDNGDGRPDGILGAKYTTGCIDPLTNAQADTCEYVYEQGTSMAAALAAGALALLWSADPEATPDEISQRFLDATIPLGARQCSGACTDYPGNAPVPGLPDICERPCGAGRLDLSRASLSHLVTGGED